MRRATPPAQPASLGERSQPAVPQVSVREMIGGDAVAAANRAPPTRNFRDDSESIAEERDAVNPNIQPSRIFI
jgi:hypothetical protein